MGYLRVCASECDVCGCGALQLIAPQSAEMSEKYARDFFVQKEMKHIISSFAPYSQFGNSFLDIGFYHEQKYFSKIQFDESNPTD